MVCLFFLVRCSDIDIVYRLGRTRYWSFLNDVGDTFEIHLQVISFQIVVQFNLLAVRVELIIMLIRR